MELYAYDPQNKRVWTQSPSGNQNEYFYGPDGREMGSYRYYSSYTTLATRKYFAGHEIGGFMVQDRLASNTATQEYFPYGESTAPDSLTSFATYKRDSSTTGLDYAQNRYYARSIGRFTSPDPYRASGGPANPQSWNRYAYVESDPVNYL